MNLNSIYSYLRPVIPRPLQIKLRRAVVQWKRKSYTDVWPIDHTAGMAPPGWQGWPDGKKFALVLTHDVETAFGRDRCLKLAGIEKGLGFRSSFNFVAEDYESPPELRHALETEGFEVAIHGLCHNDNIFRSKHVFDRNSAVINRYLSQWKSCGFRSPKMFHNLDWIHDLNILYDSSTFDTDPFEPQPDSVRTIFPIWIRGDNGTGYVEIPYTLPQDFTLFVLMKETDDRIWRKKLDWIAEKGGMALVVTHPDYMVFDNGKRRADSYPSDFYINFLTYVKEKYEGEYWSVLPRDLARYWTMTDEATKRSSRAPARKTTIIDPSKDPRWDRFVENHPLGWVCHLSGWKEVVEENFDHIKAHYIILEDGNGDIQAGLPLFEVRSWLTGSRLVSIPFATLSDPLASSAADMEALLDAAKALSKRLGIPRVEIRTTKSDVLIRDPQFAGSYYFKNHYIELNADVEKLWRSFHSKAVRYEINRASRSGLTLRVGRSKDDMAAFYELYRSTRKRLGLPTHPHLFFTSLWDKFSPKGQMVLWLAEHQKQVVAGHIFFRFNGRVSIDFLGWDKRFHKTSPNHFLFWEAIKGAQNDRFQVYDFGRTSPDNAGLMAFKGRWGTRVADLPVFSYPGNGTSGRGNKERGLLYSLASGVCRVAPDSTLDFIGKMCFNHLA
jgi:CelD/BcsL family acetyltransferase involved in cellulose biosynthesis